MPEADLLQRPSAPDALGHVHSVSGSQVSIGLRSTGPDTLHGAGITVGKFVKIQISRGLLVGVITNVSTQAAPHLREQGYHGTAQVDLMGEIKDRAGGPARFYRGVADYPSLGDAVVPLSAAEMR